MEERVQHDEIIKSLEIEIDELKSKNIELSSKISELAKQNSELEFKIKKDSIAYKALLIAFLVLLCILGLTVPINGF